MSSRLALYLLGSPQLFLDDAPVTTPRRKAMALLAYLAIERGQYRREFLSAQLWQRNPRRTLLQILKQVLQLRPAQWNWPWRGG